MNSNICKGEEHLAPLCREDVLWSGLRFEVLSEEDLAHQQAAVEDKVHSHRGVWWREAKPFFCIPCLPLLTLDHGESWPHPLRAVAGFIHLATPGTVSNSMYRVIVREGLESYSIRSLSTDRRTKLRKALSHLEVRPVERLEDLLDDGHEVYVSCRLRTGWGRNKCERSTFTSWICKVFQRPKRTILGAYFGNKLVAFMLPYVVRNVAVQSYVASHSDFLKYRPNEAIIHAFLCIARQTPKVELADFGTVSSKPSLDDFKLNFASVKELPSYVWINPLIRITLDKWIRRRYPWLRFPVPISNPSFGI